MVNSTTKLSYNQFENNSIRLLVKYPIYNSSIWSNFNRLINSSSLESSDYAIYVIN